MSSASSGRQKPCFALAAGNCRFGERCKYSHDPVPPRTPLQLRGKNATHRPGVIAPPIASSPRLSLASTLHTAKGSTRTAKRAAALHNGNRRIPHARETRSNGEAQRARNEAGKSPKKDDDEANEPRRRAEEERNRDRNAQRVRQEAEQRRRREDEAARKLEQELLRTTEEQRVRKEAKERRKKEQEEAREARRKEQEVRDRVLMAERAKDTLQRVVSGSIVTFGAGLDVRHIVTGFECCKIQVKGLPLDVREEELLDVLLQQGIDKTQLHIVDVRRHGKMDFTILSHSQAAETLSNISELMELRGNKMTLEFGAFNGGRQGRNSLLVSFWAPTSRFAVEYGDTDAAQRKVRELNGSLEAGRTMKVSMGQPLRGLGRLSSIIINNLPIDTSALRVSEISQSLSVRQLRTSTFNVDTALGYLQCIVPTGSDVDILSKDDPKTGLVSLRISCPSYEDAKGLYDSFTQPYFSLVAGTERVKVRCRLPDPMFFTIFVPAGQYRAQQTIWDELDEGIKDKKACRLVRSAFGNQHRIQIAGSNKVAVGALKVRVDNIAAGTQIPGWHPAFYTGVSPDLDRAMNSVGAYLRFDPRKRTMKVYGSPRALEAATSEIERELTRLNDSEQFWPIQPSSFRFFREQGLQELKDLFGDDCVSLNVAARQLKVKGGEQVRRHLLRLIEQSKKYGPGQSASGDQPTCPICYDTATSPRILQCGHSYCTACLHHRFSSVADGKDFPLVCVGDEANCRAPFPITVIRDFVRSEQDFERLMDLAFTAYIDNHTNEFQPCRTPDCNQIYRRRQTGTGQTTLDCPACFSDFCACCGEDVHTGMTCEVARQIGNKDEQERLSEMYLQQQRDTKRCPRCSIWMSKVDGCNHLQCKCGAHVCWRCLATFDSGQATYNHMSTTHGGFYAADPEPEPVRNILQPIRPMQVLDYDPFLGADYREQAELLRHAEANVDAHRRPDILRNNGPNLLGYNPNPMYPHRDAWAAPQPRWEPPPRAPTPQQHREGGGWCTVM